MVCRLTSSLAHQMALFWPSGQVNCLLSQRNIQKTLEKLRYRKPVRI
jgi:hypothetical protein